MKEVIYYVWQRAINLYCIEISLSLDFISIVFSLELLLLSLGKQYNDKKNVYNKRSCVDNWSKSISESKKCYNVFHTIDFSNYQQFSNRMTFLPKPFFVFDRSCLNCVDHDQSTILCQKVANKNIKYFVVKALFMCVSRQRTCPALWLLDEISRGK